MGRSAQISVRARASACGALAGGSLAGFEDERLPLVLRGLSPVSKLSGPCWWVLDPRTSRGQNPLGQLAQIIPGE
jgi:hypothetical protein